jgi:non-heme chloroperoxidase
MGTPGVRTTFLSTSVDDQVAAANKSGLRPVVFIHGLWLLPSSWQLDRKPRVIGHSFGGLLTMIVAGRGLAAASVAIGSAPFR